MARRIGKRATLAALARVVKNSPRGKDTSYFVDIAKAPQGDTGCEYTINGKPACIVGRVVMDEFGLPEPDVGIWVESTQPEELYGAFTPAANMLLRVAQEEQDDGAPWGEVLAHARKA